ncbi:MAG: nucleotidyl transferase AbiEii/AbiGii toxin family protein [Actinobacteria bacterium]|nr:nucleotidyl transferase AbiEii/AbiGii toxin family protein [Actinomycetota bacterium]
METVKIFLKDLLTKSASKNVLFKRNLLKEYLQLIILDYIYSHPEYSRLIFYGGSCLSHCYGLPRLSEDLDFADPNNEIMISELAKDLENYFMKDTDLNISIYIQKFRIYLKFPILRELKMVKEEESDLIFLKIEVFKGFGFCKNYEIEIIPLFKFNKSILIRTFDLPTLMATKIRAILYRKWEKTDKEGRTLIKVKGRDYFDLMWYLEKDVKPNMECIENINNKNELKEILSKIVEKIDSRSIQLDLEPLMENETYVKDLSGNIKRILLNQLSR